ncbi:hypothetical protein MLD38_028825 [Melastoma candidum]|uniref:Uncharacterized protein n=1 Tax=Melastoma candidum TaxID=119954 RepID=A0ACB9N2R1_9MYRT|nr:hypothetical protein MLD38_028825 [Melastoma candidum]
MRQALEHHHHLNQKIKKIHDEKKAALAAQFFAEATLRRVHAAQKDDDMPPIEAIIAPLKAGLILARLEVDTEYLIQPLFFISQFNHLIALAKASVVDDLQNKNQELMKQIEIYQEENKTLDKLHRQMVTKVENLTQMVRELEEAILAVGAAANVVRDFERRLQEMQEEKMMLEREASRAKVSANRVATVVANEWKDGNDKVMLVKPWLEERKFLKACHLFYEHLYLLKGEMQQLRDKLAVAERTARAEAQLKEKYQLRFKVLEEKLKASSNSRAQFDGKILTKGASRRQSLGGAELFLSYTQMDLHQRKSWQDLQLSWNNWRGKSDGTLYDISQKEVIILRRACRERDQSIKEKDDTIEILVKKVDMLNKAMEVEAKRMRREFAIMEKEVATMHGDKELGNRTRGHSALRGAVNCAQPNPTRNGRNM